MDKGLPAILITRSRLAEGAVDLTAVVPLDEDWSAGDAQVLDHPACELRADESRNGGIHVSGLVSGTMRVRCRRCLVSESRGMRVSVDFRLEPGVDAWDEAPGLYALDDGLEDVDLMPALREELLLALPDFPVCRPDCRGLCDVCGTDLNEGTCDCRTPVMDSRWNALRQVAGDSGVDEDDDKNQEG